jgi:hypothetical protein
MRNPLNLILTAKEDWSTSMHFNRLTAVMLSVLLTALNLAIQGVLYRLPGLDLNHIETPVQLTTSCVLEESET